ncbi:MAG: hypothetical protein Q8L14_01275 [Myxococcales bacterium]|nr:hypothetical protein [Myxococcales bacterium]
MACMSEQTPPDPSEADLDIDLLMELHAMTPAERVAGHDAALQLVQALREAGTNFYGVDPRTLRRPSHSSPDVTA